jgi:hypothetical protein
MNILKFFTSKFNSIDVSKDQEKELTTFKNKKSKNKVTTENTDEKITELDVLKKDLRDILSTHQTVNTTEKLSHIYKKLEEKGLVEYQISDIFEDLLKTFSKTEKKHFIRNIILTNKGNYKFNFDFRKERIFAKLYSLETQALLEMYLDENFFNKYLIAHENSGEHLDDLIILKESSLITLLNNQGQSKVIYEPVVKDDDWKKDDIYGYKKLVEKLQKLQKNEDMQLSWTLRKNQDEDHIIPVNILIKDGKITVIFTDSIGNEYINKSIFNELITEHKEDFKDFTIIFSKMRIQTDKTNCPNFVKDHSMLFSQNPDYFSEIKDQAFHELGSNIEKDFKEVPIILECEYLPPEFMRSVQTMTGLKAYNENVLKNTIYKDGEERLIKMNKNIQKHMMWSKNLSKNTNQRINHCFIKNLALLYLE